MRIAIGTGDRETIFADHFGESDYFCIVEILMATPKIVEYRDNPAKGTHGPHKSGTILQLLQDCDAIIIRRIGQGAFNRFPQRGKQIFLTSLSQIDDIVSKFSRGDMQFFKKYNPEVGKFEQCEA